MNDDRLLRNRAEKAEGDLEEERRFCSRCYGQHRHTLQALHAKLTEVERERDEARAAQASLRFELDGLERVRLRDNAMLIEQRDTAEQDAARLANALEEAASIHGDACGAPNSCDFSRRMRAALAAHAERVGGAR